MAATKGHTFWRFASTAERDAADATIGLQVHDRCVVQGEDGIFQCVSIGAGSTWAGGASVVVAPIDTAGMTGVVLDVDAEGDLLDSSGNGFDLAATLGPTYYTLDGKTGLYSRAAQSIYLASGAGDYPALKLLGAMTMHLLVNNYAATVAARAIVGGFGGSGETEATNFLYSMDIETTGQVSRFHEYSAGGDSRTIFQWGLPVGRWSLLTLTRASGTTFKVFLNGAKVEDNTVASGPSGGSSARFECTGFLGLFGGVVVANVEQTEAAVLAVAQQIGVAA